MACPSGSEFGNQTPTLVSLPFVLLSTLACPGGSEFRLATFELFHQIWLPQRQARRNAVLQSAKPLLVFKFAPTGRARVESLSTNLYANLTFSKSDLLKISTVKNEFADFSVPRICFVLLTSDFLAVREDSLEEKNPGTYVARLASINARTILLF